MLKLKKYKKEFLLLFITLLLLFLIGEFFSRIYLFGFVHAFSLKIYTGIGTAGFIQASDNCEIIYELKPNIKGGNVAFSKFETNSQGLRDKEYSIEKPPGVYRVAVLGDSFTMPLGVDIEKSYHSILEERFNNNEGFRYEFINFGVEGYQTDNYLAVLKHKIIKYKPDWILIGFFVGNDISATDDMRYMCNYTVPKKGNHFFESFFIQYIRKNFVNLYSQIKKEEKLKKEEEQEGGNIGGYDNEHFDKLLTELASFSYDHNLPMVFVLLPTLDYSAPSHIFHYYLIQSLCNIKSFYVIDTLPAFFKKSTGYYLKEDEKDSLKKFYISPSDHHPNDLAHSIIADVIYEKLNEYVNNPNNRYEICISQRKEYDNDLIFNRESITFR